MACQTPRPGKAEDTLQKKDTSVTFWAEQNFFCHTYDTSMTIIVTKPCIIIEVVGSYFYEKNHDRKWAFCHGRPKECHAAASPAHPGRKAHFLS